VLLAGLAACGESQESQVATSPTGRDEAPQTTPNSGNAVGAKGPIDPRARTLRATRTCTGTSVREGHLVRLPPVPRAEARRVGGTIEVRYSFLALPAGCVPRGMSISVNSVHDLGNISIPPEGASVPASRRGTIVVPVPRHGPGPFEARLSSISGPRATSEVTTIPVQE
jgi:hypothetical protein